MAYKTEDLVAVAANGKGPAIPSASPGFLNYY
jgi:hypothetical protein